MKTRLLFIATFALLLGCSRDRTEYEIRYCFDNTDMHSDFLEAYELTSGTTGNGKWRSERHHLDTVITDGDTVEWASGTLKDVARGNCVALLINTSGWRACGGGNYKLDTIFHLKKGEDNYIYITPSFEWKNRY